MPSPSRLRLFGAPTFAGDSGEHALVPERLGQLALVLATRNDWTTRDELIGLLWPELPADAARRNLRKLLFRARREDWLRGLEVRDDALRWCLDSDLQDFEAACGRNDWAAAIAAYRAAFAEGFDLRATGPFADWLRFERNRLAARFHAAAAQRLAQLADDPAARRQVAQHWLTLDPLDEDAVFAAAEAARAQGHWGEVRRLLDEYAQRLARELGVAPSARVAALVAEGGSSTAAAANRLPGAAGTGAASAASRTDSGFVGRRAELLELEALLARSECHVLTIVGPGGVGKSRFARVALARVAPRFAAATWISLEDLVEAAQVAPRIAEAMRLALAGRADPLAQVVAALREVRALLVLDNAEHLPGLGSICESLVQSCTELKLIVTSRARLSIDGEWLLPLAGLPVPDEGEVEPDVLRAFDAVRLFELRAQAVAPSFGSADRPAGEVGETARLVRVLDGAPLAIELAAAWVRLLPVAGIRREIEASLDLLAGDGNAPDRHRSVRASFEHSWRLLSPVEQRCLACLSTFAGPFDRAAAAHVAQAPLAVLAALTDKSLLRALGDGRFTFHPLMQQCAREHLVDGAGTDGADVRARHLDYFTQMLARVPDTEIGEGRIFDGIEAILEDCRAAWRSAVESGRPDALELMAPPLRRFFNVKGRKTEGIALFADAQRALAGAPASPATHAAIQHALATLHYGNGELAAAEAAIVDAERIYRSLRRASPLRNCVFLHGAIASTRGDVAAAERHFQEALELATAAGDDASRGKALNGLANCARGRGDYEGALALQRQSLALHESSGNVLGQALVLNGMGVMLYTMHRYAEAQRALVRGLALSDEHGLASAREFVLYTLAMAEIELGQLDLARSHLQKSLEVDRIAGVGLVSACAFLGLARVSLRGGDSAAARPHLDEGLRRAYALAAAPIQIYALHFVAEWLNARGERRRAAELWTFIDTHPQSEAADRDDARRALGELRLTTEEAEAAARTASALALDALIETLRAELAG